ncbi:aldo/keto reductase [Deinococcus rubellus]|uniref:Aldo/keto reductase n=1 Tax=Deinococcus rubellus TaxID=1889240 RepID=A0ABY5YEV7_9DEIO|nr:aldo/keto reductase [Deinococcus rubellus]UWX63573.1 aldo/keto reductase [Deinococcus rubellus]
MSARLGLGLAALGRPGYINLGHAEDLGPENGVADLRARSHVLLDAAWDAGLRWFDAARSYGLAEQFLGEWLARHPERRQQLIVSSKWGYTYVADWRSDAEQHEVKDHSPGTFERQWPETLAALGSPPDLYLIHSVTPDSPALGDAALLARLDVLAERGVTVGLSVSGSRQADTIRAALALGWPFAAVQATWNVLEPSAGETLAEAKAAGWQVIVKEALANGRLTARGDVPGLNALSAESEVAPDALALAAALVQPWADVILSGASTRAQLESNLGAAHLVGADLTGLAGLAESPEHYWHTRAGLAWN